MWQRCAVGQTWNGNTCNGTAATYTDNQAMQLTSNFAGQTDWRLPTVNELLTLVEYKTYDLAINTNVFPNTPGLFWSASAYASNLSNAWFVYFGDGNDGSGSKNGGPGPVLLVRGRQSFISSINENAIYDAATQVLSIQDVLAFNQHYQVQLQGIGNNLYTLKTVQSLSAQQHSQPAQYDDYNMTLLLPKVQALGSFFKVTLKNRGDFVFRLENFAVIPVDRPPTETIAAQCVANNFTTAKYNAITIGMTPDQVNQVIGCQYDPQYTVRAQTSLHYTWIDNTGGALIAVFFDPDGTKVTPVGDLFKVASGF